MIVELLERERELLALDELLRQAASGHGQTVLMSGEAGIGKTALVEGFLARYQQHEPMAHALWGTCEALFTPRPLGPLYDIAQQAQTSLRAQLAEPVNRATLFAAVLEELLKRATPSTPAILVIEDIHWADEATLDLIKFLARRVHRLPCLLIFTYRDDELGYQHPLRLVLGDLPARDVTRLWLTPLSAEAVATFAHHAGRRADELFAVTGGNPFFLTEVLADDANGLPTSVRDAVLTRVARLSDEARHLLDVVAVAPGRIERWVIATVADAEESPAAIDPASNPACGPAWDRWLDECFIAGIVQLDDGAISYRHELARQAVESALSPTRKQLLHAQVLHALLARCDDQGLLARLVHHAAQAEDRAMVLRFAPAAARQASAQGAHREAAAQYDTALRYADQLEIEQHACLLEAASWEYYLVGQMEDSLTPREATLPLWRALDRPEKVGHTLRQLSRLQWFLGNLDEAGRYGREAVAILETLPPSQELAMAYGNLSHLHMLMSETADAVCWGNHAIELGEQLGDAESVAYALDNVGCALLNDGDESGWASLERSLRLALEHGYEEHVARAYSNLATTWVERRNFAAAQSYLHDGMAYCAEHDLGSWEHCLRGQQARARLGQGDWNGADEDATAILKVSWANGTNRAPALMVLGAVRVRRGDPGAEPVLDEARDLALLTGELAYVEPTMATRAEWRWMQGRLAEALAEAEMGLRKALAYGDPWFLGEAALWVWRLDGLTEVPRGMAEPYALQIAGNWRAAADYWERAHCPYEQAMALMDGDESAQLSALAIFERLGARPAAEMLRQRLRTAGVRGLPRGPRPTTRSNPYGLTNRQLEILLLLTEGLHNTEIANRLATTTKTADHHVSDVLAKLQVRSRAEAVSLAHQLGIVPPKQHAG